MATKTQELDELKQAIIAKISDRLNDIIPGTPCIELYRKTIEGMSAEELEGFIQALENGVQDFPNQNQPSTTISLIVPNMGKGSGRLNIDRNLKLAEKMGHSFHEQCWLTNPVTGQTYLTNRRYMTLLLPIRRQAQTLDAKISVAENDHQIDELTGQVTGDSKGSSVSYPEIQMLESQGLRNSMLELLKPRGGDELAWRLMKHRLIETGEFSLSELDNIDSEAKVNQTFRYLLNAMHIRTTL